jgi:hypothetical protein
MLVGTVQEIEKRTYCYNTVKMYTSYQIAIGCTKSLILQCAAVNGATAVEARGKT